MQSVDIKWEPIDPESGHHMTLLEFVQGVDCALFTDDDGFGEYADETMVSNQRVYPSTVDDIEDHEAMGFTHVMWYNK